MSCSSEHKHMHTGYLTLCHLNKIATEGLYLFGDSSNLFVTELSKELHMLLHRHGCLQPCISITFRITGFMDFVHRPEI
jgi:hypothetical protein